MTEYINLFASFIEILSAAAAFLRRLGRKKQADATEKAIKEIESKEKQTEEDARAITQKVLQDELSKEEAIEVLDVVSVLEGLFPIRPKGKVIEYGRALLGLIRNSIGALARFRAFQLFGEIEDRRSKIYRLEVMMFASSLWEILRNDLEAGFWRGYVLQYGISGHRYLERVPFYLQHYETGARAYLSFDNIYPYSFFLAEEQGKETQVRLDIHKLGFLREGLMHDVKNYLEKISREYEVSQPEERKIKEALTALRKLSAAT